MRTFGFEKRLAKQEAFCRGCDKVLHKNIEMITGYSWRGRGQHIHFCLACAEAIGKLVDQPEVTNG